MCLNWIESNQTLQWLGLAFNTFVHVIMSASCILIRFISRAFVFALKPYFPSPSSNARFFTCPHHLAPSSFDH